MAMKKAAMKPGGRWPAPAIPGGQVALLLDGQGPGEDDPTANLSAATRCGKTLFLGSDEGVSLERLIATDGHWAGHSRIAVADLVDLASTDEADIEGLTVDDGWLWVLGSHARTRPKVEKAAAETIDLNALAVLKDTRPRCLVARIPLVETAPGEVQTVRRDGRRRAGLLMQTKAGNALAKALAACPLIGPFAAIAAKEGGIDLEGLAVAGTRVAIGMRGPVIQGFAVLLECEIRGRRGGRLRMAGPLFRRLLALEGLGIRDLERVGDDLLILAGPSTNLDGPCAVYRWRGWLTDLPRDATRVRLHRPERILELPFGRGDDHPEGLVALVDAESRAALLVVCDSPASERLDAATRSLTCDVFDLT